MADFNVLEDGAGHQHVADELDMLALAKSFDPRGDRSGFDPGPRDERGARQARWTCLLDHHGSGRKLRLHACGGLHVETSAPFERRCRTNRGS